MYFVVQMAKSPENASNSFLILGEGPRDNINDKILKRKKCSILILLNCKY